MSKDRKILLSWYTDPRYILPFSLSDKQITVGPRVSEDQPQMMFAGWTPNGVYDLKAVLEAQQLATHYDAVVVWADASRTNMPLNLGAFHCPKVLCVGDTHHLSQPLRALVAYAQRAGFDFIVSSYNRHHLHWFLEGGFANVAWIPGITVRHLPRPFRPDRRRQIAFVGQRGIFHPRRQRLLAELRRDGQPLAAYDGTREEAADLYASSILSFNASLNGDLNLRTFEILSAGGCLLTDRLAPQSGLHLLLRDGRDFVGYSTPAELIDRARFLLLNPDKAFEIARAGNRSFVRKMLPQRQARTLLRWVFDGVLDDLYRPEPGQEASGSDLSPPLQQRLRVYEELQELQRQVEAPRVVFAASLPRAFVSDAQDLHRIERTVAEIRVAGGTPASIMETRWDCIVAPSKTDLPDGLRTDKFVEVPA